MNRPAKQTNPKPSSQPDPFAGDFSQERAAITTILPVLQWHGGIVALAGDDSMKARGGFFIEDDRIIELGLDPASPPPGFERVTLRLGGKQVPGWGAVMLHIAFVLTEFHWEEREGSETFPATEYERRKSTAPGTERALRGRTRALVGVRELLDAGVVDPLVLSVRGSYSQALNAILRDLGRMAAEATKLRRRAGHEGAIPREAFYVPVYAGEMEEVGMGKETSTVARPKADIPEVLERDFLAASLAEATHRAPGGTFDQWVALHGEAWAQRIAEEGMETGAESYPVQAASVEDLTPRGQVLYQIAQLHTSMGDVADETSTDEQWEALLAAMGAAGLVHSDYDRLAMALLGEAVDPDDLSQAECLAMTAFLGTSDGKRWIAGGGLR
jgi:hypothetical protein